MPRRSKTKARATAASTAQQPKLTTSIQDNTRPQGPKPVSTLPISLDVLRGVAGAVSFQDMATLARTCRLAWYELQESIWLRDFEAPGVPALYRAIEQGDIDQVGLVLDRYDEFGAPPSLLYGNGVQWETIAVDSFRLPFRCPPVTLAVYAGNLNVLKLLVNHKIRCPANAWCATRLPSRASEPAQHGNCVHQHRNSTDSRSTGFRYEWHMNGLYIGSWEDLEGAFQMIGCHETAWHSAVQERRLDMAEFLLTADPTSAASNMHPNDMNDIVAVPNLSQWTPPPDTDMLPGSVEWIEAMKTELLKSYPSNEGLLSRVSGWFRSQDSHDSWSAEPHQMSTRQDVITYLLSLGTNPNVLFGDWQGSYIGPLHRALILGDNEPRGSEMARALIVGGAKWWWSLTDPCFAPHTVGFDGWYARPICSLVQQKGWAWYEQQKGPDLGRLLSVIHMISFMLRPEHWDGSKAPLNETLTTVMFEIRNRGPGGCKRERPPQHPGMLYKPASRSAVELALFLVARGARFKSPAMRRNLLRFARNPANVAARLRAAGIWDDKLLKYCWHHDVIARESDAERHLREQKLGYWSLVSKDKVDECAREIAHLTMTQYGYKPRQRWWVQLGSSSWSTWRDLKSHLDDFTLGLDD
ncbi:hypothetical protein B0T25DRAFT_571471 [Lasiosphaeria hispida]|uniref:Uncharacterized protein n=1 Tax=Lasiosphaeria hispida TaxID=260671 RepID=A0AAJ0HB25_9PEZI|nr:hypothetical protein B0T25DRAFT_571471 [Lasiosphaeria hispida]